MKIRDEVKHALEVVQGLHNSAEDFRREASVLDKDASELMDLLSSGDWHAFGEKVRAVRERAQVTLACIEELAEKAGV